MLYMISSLRRMSHKVSWIIVSFAAAVASVAVVIAGSLFGGTVKFLREIRQACRVGRKQHEANREAHMQQWIHGIYKNPNPTCFQYFMNNDLSTIIQNMQYSSDKHRVFETMSFTS